jgi:hypothetical protein
MTVKNNKKTTPLKAIRAMCEHCNGGPLNDEYIKLITDCQAFTCPIYSFRFGKDPFNKKGFSKAEIERRTDRLQLSSN